jgi:hypothetical protein
VPSYTVGYIDVYRNGALLGSADYTATNGTTVVLANAASSGDLIETISFFVSSVLNAIPAVANAVTTSYINDGAVTQAKLGAGVAGNGPAFSAYRGGSNQSITASTNTKVQLNTEEFDTANAFDSTTNYRFTPQVAGYYQITGQIEVDGTGITRSFSAIYKNGSLSKIGNDGIYTSSYRSVVNGLIYLNGSTDYLELYGWANGTSPVFYNDLGRGTYFSGVLVRSA